MAALEQAKRVWDNLLKLGTRRLIGLGMTGLAVFLVTGLAGYYLSRPTQELLYGGLDREDVSRIASALKEANIDFDVSADSTAVYVHYGQTAQARMLLAEKGLPNSPNAGNELFDKLGSLGLTSFMQQVTRVRALEGELARTIQLMSAVKAARVHLVLPDDGSFRRESQPPSASVVVRTEVPDDVSVAKAIRHLVAAAVPGMKPEEVTVLDTDGLLLASGEDSGDSEPGQMLSLEKTFSKEIQDNISRTLTPFFGFNNFQISVATRINTDRKQTNETVFDPDSRVERSVRVVRSNETSQNSTNQPPTSVTQNLPPSGTQSDNGKQSNEENQKREETTNYEVSSKTIQTISGGFEVEHISVAVLVNRASLVAALGGKATPEAIDKELADLNQIVASAAGTNTARGDMIKISAVDFVESGRDLTPVPPPTWQEILLRQTGTAINGGVILVVALLMLWFGVRPAIRALAGSPAIGASAAAGYLGADSVMLPEPVLPMPDAMPMAAFPTFTGEPNLIEDLADSSKRAPVKRLEQIVEFDEQQAVNILKLWMRQRSAA
ncbi:flagellar basal-body MS-ring/collar protein FliF [uncultured Methylovirgula sp.]|uniref:flagellar basal-body MS-ring/collar protein FliF n=1 Tax=uncultured Methylovirgula sp. TaxID=1285960 RepID=UPI0026141ED5|nr:flagellar basal-body MS-ring/collar protein FliF [uncultured Methylovirgula sp.]